MHDLLYGFDKASVLDMNIGGFEKPILSFLLLVLVFEDTDHGGG
ncbi:hypothetical protein SAMN04489724_2113 [Algoriphagus locisalis]|uniref:Uncharacterized protein n=1 Tax=Algoriphagus locisalis TaxID=305507 RepID=A0A1I7AP76_9BACT|nr:hypothetical protein [Algoriphagus locisalis]SFT76758.1 hypothetical protein SAMN04489724_2113 [Algoriphagus locisalis]